MTAGDWATAAAGLLRVRATLGEETPRAIFAQAATCLHRLGRYVEAEAIAQEGLGTQRELITRTSSPPAEADILRQWRQPMPAEPVVSILCMAYNHERYIENTIQSFLTQQTDVPFEILIHDDASTDGTAAIVSRWQERYPSIIRSVLQKENQFSRGVRSLDVLLKQARGRYIATCEGDDYWLEPSKLRLQIALLEQHPEFSCSAHNYYLYDESELSVRPWLKTRRDYVLTERQLMNLTRLLWIPTLVFRKTFSELPAERTFAAISDSFLTSYLGTFGKCAYFESFIGSVRRANQYSFWTPLSDEKKDYIRVKTWFALVRMHETRGNHEVAADLLSKIGTSPLDEAQKAALTQESLEFQAALAARRAS